MKKNGVLDVAIKRQVVSCIFEENNLFVLHFLYTSYISLKD